MEVVREEGAEFGRTQFLINVLVGNRLDELFLWLRHFDLIFSKDLSNQLLSLSHSRSFRLPFNHYSPRIPDRRILVEIKKKNNTNQYDSEKILIHAV